MTTKERILYESLKLFSQYGYDAVSVEQIALAVGIKAPSLYKHYKSKHDIFDAIFEEMQRRYNSQTEKMEIHFNEAVKDRDKFSNINADSLVKQVQELVKYSISDEFVSCFRKMMTIEQFRCSEFSDLYTQRYVYRMVNYHEKLFTELIDAGAMIEGNVHSMAMQYICPIIVFLSICDRQPEMESQIMMQIDLHVRQFFMTNQVKK